MRRYLIIIIVVACILWIPLMMQYYNRSVKKVASPASDTRSQLLTTKASNSKYRPVILYNRIPKTGSTSLMSLLYKIHVKNQFSLTFVNVSSQNHIFTFIDQYKFAKNISLWDEFHPGIFHGHFPYINFRKLSFKPPLYINMVREPLDRLVSHYYFIRYGDTFLPNKKRTFQGDTRSLDQCVKDESSKCSLKKLWVQVPYFCGIEPECWIPGNKQALKKAKANVINNYLLVGITENMNLFIELLEEVIPEVFKDVNKLYKSDGGVYIRKTKYKKPLEEETINFFKNSDIYKIEKEFYEFVKSRFLRLYKNCIISKKLYQVSYVKLKLQNEN